MMSFVKQRLYLLHVAYPHTGNTTLLPFLQAGAPLTSLLAILDLASSSIVSLYAEWLIASC